VTVNKKTSPSVGSIAKLVAIATLASKLFGFVRELVMAAAFGIGAVSNAYAYAYIVPSFFLVMLGGINGPFHSSLVSVLAKKDKSEAAPIVETVTTIVSIILLIVTIVIMVSANTIIDLSGSKLALETKELAVLQLQIMAPLALLAGLIGIGFGTLSAVIQRYSYCRGGNCFSSIWRTIKHTAVFSDWGDCLGWGNIRRSNFAVDSPVNCAVASRDGDFASTV